MWSIWEQKGASMHDGSRRIVPGNIEAGAPQGIQNCPVWNNGGDRKGRDLNQGTAGRSRLADTW